MAHTVPASADALLTREHVAWALTEIGYACKPATLATKATRGGGPPFRIFGRVPLYRWGDALAWAEARTSPVGSSTSEIRAKRAPAEQRAA